MTVAGRPQTGTWLLGTTLLVALLTGGGTLPGLSSDTMIQLLAIATATAICLRNMQQRIDRAVFWFMVAAMLCLVLQLLPVATDLTRSTQSILPGDNPMPEMEPATISLGPGRTIEVAVFVASLCLFLAAVLKLQYGQVLGLIPFFLAGVVCNMAGALVQYSFGRVVEIEGVLPYVMRAGFFANENHFSALVVVSIPLAFAWFMAMRRAAPLVGYLCLCFLTLFAAGSRAGMIIGLAVTSLSALSLRQRGVAGIVGVVSGAGLLAAFGMTLRNRFDVEELVAATGRLQTFRATLDGIADNLPFGVGYGNFVTAYTAYEPGDAIFHKYMNHAHNDYLELVFEGGLPALALIAAFLVLVTMRTAQTIHRPLQRAVALSLGVLLVHSLVDYPLRTMALSLTMCLLLGLLFHGGAIAVPPAGRRPVQIA